MTRAGARGSKPRLGAAQAAEAAKPADKDRGPVGSIVNAIDVLRYISESRQPAGVTTIARALNLNPSSCFNILKTLTNEGFVEVHPKAKTYTLGTEALRLARSVMVENGALNYVRPYIQEIASEFRVTSALWRLTSQDRWVLVGFEESAAVTRIHLSIGQRLPRYAGAAGRCAAAFSDLDLARLKQEFDQVRWHRRPPIKEHLAEVAAVRVIGWALDDHQLHLGVTSIAAPLVDEIGRIRYCVTCIMFAGQHDRAGLEVIGQAAAKVANQASRYIFGGDQMKQPAAASSR